MKLGGPTFKEHHDPDSWVESVRHMGFQAAFCPVTVGADEGTARAYEDAARRAGIVIAEAGAWNSPLGPDPQKSRAALDHCIKTLELAEMIGARCCVNTAGSRGEPWDGPDERNFTGETFEMIVETSRTIIDSVKPKRTFFSLEPMPWMYPDSIESYLRLIKAIDRKAFAVHLDPFNMILTPNLYFNSGAFLRECFSKLGPYIKACHAKDLLMKNEFMVHIDEVRPGLGRFDYGSFLKELSALPGDVPLLIEHLPDESEYRIAADYIRSVAKREGLVI